MPNFNDMFGGNVADQVFVDPVTSTVYQSPTPHSEIVQLQQNVAHQRSLIARFIIPTGNRFKLKRVIFRLENVGKPVMGEIIVEHWSAAHISLINRLYKSDFQTKFGHNYQIAPHSPAFPGNTIEVYVDLSIPINPASSSFLIEGEFFTEIGGGVNAAPPEDIAINISNTAMLTSTSYGVEYYPADSIPISQVQALNHHATKEPKRKKEKPRKDIKELLQVRRKRKIKVAKKGV